MAGPPTSSFSQVSIVFTGDGVPTGAVTTFGVGSGIRTPFEVATEIAPVVEDTLAGLVTAACVFDTLDVKRGPVATGPTASIPLGFSGEQAAASAPPQVSTLVRKQVEGVSGRFWGRMFFPGVNEGQVDQGGTLSPAFLDDGQSKLDDFLAALDALDYSLYVFSATSSDPRIVNSLQLQSKVATQRRRLRR